jgi:release factor glutamine methyltransferase
MTVLEVLTAATGYLQKNGVESPRLNAEHLLAHVLGKKRLDLYMEFDRPLSDAERAPLRDLIRERGTGKPLQHLMGTAEFFGRSFLCDARALVPRPETEQLVELCLDLLKGKTAPRILDVGTGSGIIAITLSLELPGAQVTATDLLPPALSLARENIARHNLAERLASHEADLWPKEGAPFDLIVANLPYINSDEIPGLSREVRHDPATALDGGAEGLDIVDRLISEAHTHIAPSGIVALEIGHDQAERVVSLFTKRGFSDAKAHSDYQDVLRFVTARAKNAA